MGNQKTQIKRKKSPKKCTPNKIKIGGMTFTEFSPAQWIKDNPDLMLKGLLEAFCDGDKEAVQDIMGALTRTHGIAKVSKKTKVSQALISDAIDSTKDPTLETVCKLMQFFYL